MAHRSFAAALVATMVVAVVAAGSVFAHGDDTEYRDPGYGMGYGIEPDRMDEYCPACGMMGGRGRDHGMMGGGPAMSYIAEVHKGVELYRSKQAQVA